MRRHVVVAWLFLLVGCNGDQTVSPPVPGTGDLVVEGGPAAVAFRIVGPGPLSTPTGIPPQLYSIIASTPEPHQTGSDSMTIALFGDQITGTVGRISLLGLGTAGQYTVTVLQAADAENRLLAPGTVRVRLVSASAQ